MTEEQVPDTERPLPGPLVTALCVTHERPKWEPWVFGQINKQGLPLLIHLVDSTPGARGLMMANVEKISALSSAIAPKRNLALASVTTPYFAWFDDDDWSHPERLERCVRLLETCPELVAAGPLHAYKIDARTLRSDAYTSRDNMIFNGAVYRTSHWQSIKFNESLSVAEDTDWQKRGLRKQAYAIVNQVLCSWLCHSSNIANRADRILFNERFPAQLTEFKNELESNPEFAR